MVRALLDGSKTQTRRVVKGYPLDWLEAHNFTPEFVALPSNKLCPYGFAGDELWVKETHWRDDEDGAILFAANPGNGFATLQLEAVDLHAPICQPHHFGDYRHARGAVAKHQRIGCHCRGVASTPSV